MEALRVTGLMSGLDTNSIVDAYMTSAKAPIVKLNQEIDELNFEKTTYNNLITMITDVKNSMLSLKMESTFKSKITTTTKEEIATAVAGINTPTGSYTLTVDKVAEPAYATSIYTNKILAQAGAGIKSFSPSFSPYDQLEGTHTVDIYQGSNYGYNDKWFAKDTFTGNLNETFIVNHTDKADKTLVNGNGELNQDIKGEYAFVYEYNGKQESFTVSLDYTKGTSLNKIAADLDLEINAKMDALYGNDSKQTMKVTLNIDDNGFNFSFYDVDSQNEIEVLGFVNTDTTKVAQDIKQTFTVQHTDNTGTTSDIAIDIDIKAGASVTDMADEIKKQIKTNNGIDVDVEVKYDDKTSDYIFTIKDPTNNSTFSSIVMADTSKNLGIYATYKSQATKEITNVMVSNSAEKLGTKLNSKEQGGFFTPGKLEFEDGKSVKEGTFKVYQDASAVCRPETYTTFYGDTFDKIKNANPAIDREEIDEWLNTKIGSKTSTGNTFFDDGTVFEDLNGEFYINGVKIEIEDYKQLTPNELMAKVNGSGAGVTMSYDHEKNIFQVKNNKGGAVELTMGNDRDTSSIFEVFKVGLNSGATYVRGQDKGSIDTSTTISKLSPPFTYPMKSGTFSINGVSIYVDINKDSIQDVIDKVNKSGAGVTMAYDTNTDKFSLTSNSNERIKVGSPNDTSSFLLSTGLLYMQKTEQTIGTEGTKAKFTLNGTKYTRDTNEIKDVVPGMTFNISSTGTTVFNVKTDTDKAVKAVAEFASKYNTLINALNPTTISYKDELRKNYSDPLTDDKKATMSEDEIKKYQENYEKIAYHDIITKSSEVRSLKMGIRSNLTSTVNSDNSKYHTILDIGFVIAGSNTRNTEVTKLGLLFDVSTDQAELETYIKESSKFVSILNEDPEGVYNFFADSKTVYEKDPVTGKETSKVVNVGWGKTYSDYLDTTVNSTSALYKKTSTNGTIESEISSIKSQIDAKTRRVEMYLERLYAQFAAMEQRVGALQQSASYLTNVGNNNVK